VTSFSRFHAVYDEVFTFFADIFVLFQIYVSFSVFYFISKLFSTCVTCLLLSKYSAWFLKGVQLRA